MTEFAKVAESSFLEIWKAYGRPYLRIYDPITEWTLPAGVTYNPTTDRFEDGDGDAVTVSYVTAADYRQVRYVPRTRKGRAPLPAVEMAEGYIEQPALTVYMEWSAANAAALAACWAVQIGGLFYRTTARSEWLFTPAGSSTPVFVEFGLIEQIKTYA